jgi:hypothetical protein
MLTSAIENNVDWCDLVCRANGLAPQRALAAWASNVRTPNLYPDAVTRSESAEASVLDAVDSSEGCSIKDSFATLDLHPHGLSVLFEAAWIGLPPKLSGLQPTHRSSDGRELGSELEWALVESPSEFALWTAAWGRTNDSRCTGAQSAR